LLTPAAQYITHNYISPQYFQNAINYSVERKVHTQEQADAYFNLNSYIIMASLAGLSMGVVTSAIVALVVRNKTNKNV